MIFGNQMVEKTLVVYFTNAEGHYSMTQVCVCTVQPTHKVHVTGTRFEKATRK